MTSIWLFIISLIPPLILYRLFIWSRRRSYFLRTLILGATLFHEVLLVVFPAIYSVFTDFKLEDRMFAWVTAEDLLLVMTGESLFILMFALGFVVRLPHSAPQEGRLISVRMSERSERLILNILIVAGCLVYAPNLFFKVEGVADLPMGQALSWLNAIFWYTPLVACVFVLTKRGGLSMNPVRTLLAAIPLLSLVVISLTTGIRGRIMWAVSLLLVAGLFNQQKKIIAISLVMAILLIPIFAVLGNGDIRGTMMTGSSRAEIFTLVYEEGKKRIIDYKDLRDVFLDALAWRAQGVRNSVMLYQDFERGGGGFKTYLGSIFFPVPRLIWADKPMIGSLDHTEFGSAIYKVMELAYGELGTMGPMLASAHAYWEGGWIWLIAAGLITGLLWNMIFMYCKTLPDNIAAIIALTFAAALMVDGLLTMMVPLYSLIIAAWLSLLPLLFIYKGILVITKIGVRTYADKESNF